LFAVFDQLLVELVQHFEERLVRRNAVHLVVFEMALGFRSCLPPNLEAKFHRALALSHRLLAASAPAATDRPFTDRPFTDRPFTDRPLLVAPLRRLRVLEHQRSEEHTSELQS